MDGRGHAVTFHGDYIQRGMGEWAGHIQMKKEESYFCLTQGDIVCLRFHVLRRYNSYGDFTGVPTVYDAVEGGNEVELSREEVTVGEKEYYAYTALVWTGHFRLENQSSNALYLLSVENVG